MANAPSTSAGGYLLSHVNWSGCASYVWANPRRALVNAVGAYYISRYILRLTRRLAVQGVRRTLASLYHWSAGVMVRGLRTIPGAHAAIDRQVNKTILEIEQTVAPEMKNEPRYVALPAESMSTDHVLAELERRSEMDNKWQNGKQSGTVYHGGEDIRRITTQAFSLFSVSNPLHPEVFPGLRRIEAEIVAMVLEMYHAPPEAAGTTTSGGTESIVMAVRANLVWAKEHRGVTEPEMIVPVTAHAAFDKAAEYFGINLIHIPIDADTKRVNLTLVKRAINRNTIMLVGSAPNFPHGIVDDIAELSHLAEKYRIGLHVDCCLGGFLLPFMDQAGYPIAPFDFRLPGVTSISCDTHKYGFAPKGSSVVMYRTRALRQAQYFVSTDWTGGIYASPTIAGSRPGALLAGCWAAMLHMGTAGYVRSTKYIVQAARHVAESIRTDFASDLYLMGDPQVSVVAFGAYAHLNLYGVNDEMNARGWGLNVLQFPTCVHFCFTLMSAPMADQFLTDLKAAVEQVKAHPDQYKEGSAAIYGLATTVPDRSIVGDIAKGFVNSLYKV